MNLFRKLIREKNEKIKKQEKPEKNIQKTVSAMIKKNLSALGKMGYECSIFTTYGGSPLTIYSFAKTAQQAQKEIEARPDFQSWVKKPKRHFILH